MSRLAGILLVLALAGCAGTGPVIPPRLPAGSSGAAVELGATPFFAQTDYQCGPAALAMLLQAAGSHVTPSDLVPAVYLPARQGSLQLELIAATRRQGRLPYVIAPRLADLLEEVRAGRPVLVLQNLGLRAHPAWHYAVVIGYLPASDKIILRSGTTRRRLMDAARFLKTWERGGGWGLLVLEPGGLPARPETGPYLQAAADLESVGQLRAAHQSYATAAQRWPDNASAWLGLGNTHYTLGSPDEAEQAFRQALQADPGYLAAYNNLAMLLAKRGCRTAALEVMERAFELARPGDALYGTLMETRREILQRPPVRGERPGTACHGIIQQP